MNIKEKTAIISRIANNSRDPSFLGYPFGLIDADQFARVEYIEKDTHALQFFSLASKTGVWERILQSIRCSDAHDLLNQILGD